MVVKLLVQTFTLISGILILGYSIYIVSPLGCFAAMGICLTSVIIGAIPNCLESSKDGD